MHLYNCIAKTNEYHFMSSTYSNFLFEKSIKILMTGCIIGVWLADRIGRRWTHFSLLAISALLFFVIMWLVYDPSLSPVITVCCMIIKMNISATFVVSYIQVLELLKCLLPSKLSDS